MEFLSFWDSAYFQEANLLHLGEGIVFIYLHLLDFNGKSRENIPRMHPTG